jgi:hypothetical protein
MVLTAYPNQGFNPGSPHSRTGTPARTSDAAKRTDVHKADPLEGT